MPRLAPLAALALIGMGLSGCILGTERPDANLEVPAGYRAAPRAPDSAVPALDWWRGFRSTELTRLIESAQAANLDIAVAVAQILQADAQAGIAGAPLLPSLTGTGTAERLRTATSSSSSASSRSTSQFNAGLTASYMIDFWGKNRATLYAAEESATAARYNRDVVALTATATVANTYFELLTAQDRLRIARRNAASAERILTLIRQQFTAGTASQLEVSQQETLVATQRASIPPLEIIVRQNSATLALLVARAPAKFTVNGGSLARLAVPRVTPGIPSELLRQRPDVMQAEAQLAGSNFSVESARAAFFPQIQLTADTGFQSKALSSLFGPGAWYYTLAASLTQPILDGNLLKSQLEQAQGAQLENLQAYRKAVLSAFTDVEKALVALQQTSLQERLQGEVVASSRRAFEVAEAQLRGGTVNLVSVLQVQQTFFSAEDNLAQVRLTRFQAATSLFQALGGGWTQAPKPAAPRRF
ncbi:efflux transporter outer membrane subunit [Bosea sp. 685]|uniref:efflux transporter outer membrane subunit n=1 Tax=Bosea sp. 685 TaxID=3080057 RepID=UPI002892F43E|nr:efflux transporter outer membrane subunit [Bosea sp. 685]WNJ93785.1 efflux transporter outer membrane subunit [Bosea sp. 685]